MTDKYHAIKALCPGAKFGVRNNEVIWIDEKPKYIDYESYTKKDFIPESKNQELINNFLNAKYCLNK